MDPDTALIRKLHPDRVPVICEPSRMSTIPPLKNKKFLIPKDCSLAAFVFRIRSSLQLTEKTSIVVFINNDVPVLSTTFRELDAKYSFKDGLLHISYMGESTFG